MLIDVQTKDGPRTVRVCDYCQTVCIPGGRFCSGRCSRQWTEQWLLAEQRKNDSAKDTHHG
jgi:hypothetical protein